MAISITKREAERAESVAAIIREYVPLDRDDKDGRLVKHVNAKIADWKIAVKALDWLTACYTPGAKKVGI